MNGSVYSLIDIARAYASDCHDSNVPASDVEYLGSHNLRYETGGNLFSTSTKISGKLTDYAYRQFNARIGGPPIDWLEKKCPEDFEPEVINRMLLQEAQDNRVYLVRGKGDAVRAVLSDEYTVFDNTRFLDLFERYLDGANAIAHRASIADHLRAYILFPEIQLSNKHGGLHLGVYIRNSEIGDGGAKITGGLYRSVCKNGVVFGWEQKESTVFNHRYYDSNMIAAMVAAATAKALEMSDVAAKLFVASESVHIEKKSINPLLERYAKKYGVTKKDTDEIVGAAVGNASEYGRASDLRLMDVVNSITYTAQRKENETMQEAFERMAGEVLAHGSGYTFKETESQLEYAQMEMAF